ncbi:MAG: hypothetical protein JRG89_23630 [Deltaproteobacteria bacterium]|nr:hypothetical protein [Deltaproteobacteria bacterium]MBW2722958.1 hypothetical protein [Deltaproteobacteria bacterium]
MILTLISIVTIFTFMAFFISAGQGYLAKNQLQISVDSVARGALGFTASGFSQFFSKLLALRIPRDIIALEGRFIPPPSPDSVVFGDWNYQTSEFRPGGSELAPAVQVDLAYAAGSPKGPIDLMFAGLFLNNTQTMSISAQATAATSCREFIFVVDVSTGMADEMDRALQLVDGFVQALDSASLPGDKMGMAVYAGDAMSPEDYANDGGAFWGGPVPLPLIPIPTNRTDIDDWLFALQAEANVSCPLPPKNRTEDMPTRGRGSCLGKGDQNGINRAIRMYQESTGSCSVPGERVIILITSDTPCFYWGGPVGDSFNFYGGSFSQAYAAADDALAAGISILPVLIDRGDEGNCPFRGAQLFQHEDSPEVYIDKMARGFVTQGLVDPSQSEINAVISQIAQAMQVRIVK